MIEAITQTEPIRRIAPATSLATVLAERQLASLLRAKDQRAFSVLYDRYAPALYSIALKIVQAAPLAQDVLQETFVKIWRGIHQYDPQRGRLFTWLLNIARNTAIDTVRQKQWQADYKRNQEFRRSQPVSTHPLDGPISCSTPVDHIGLDALLARLPQEQYQLIECLYFKGYTQAEAAEQLHIPLGTVKTRLRTAMNQLRKWVKPKLG